MTLNFFPLIMAASLMIISNEASSRELTPRQVKKGCKPHFSEAMNMSLLGKFEIKVQHYKNQIYYMETRASHLRYSGASDQRLHKSNLLKALKEQKKGKEFFKKEIEKCRVILHKQQNPKR